MKAVKFDADTGHLDVAPGAPAYSTKVRWIASKLIAAANEQVPDAGVRTLHVLPPAPGKASSVTAAADPSRLSPHPPCRRRALLRRPATRLRSGSFRLGW